MSSSKPERIISGFRPTSDLTIGNYLGAVRPSLDIQEDPDKDLFVFVADLHGLTDHDPREIAPYRNEVIHDCLALGLDPERSTVYLQSDTEAQVSQIANRLSPYVSVAELARTPNLKEKMQAAVRNGKVENDDSTRANFGLLGYPVLMAADIFAQDSVKVAVGEDQEPHLELARLIAKRFNKRFERDGQPVLVEPLMFSVDALRIVSLDGKGKMSKTNPSQSIMLDDDPGKARKKIQRAVTTSAGEWNSTLESHFMVAAELASNPELVSRLDELKQAHMDGRPVMGEFKKIWADSTEEFLVNFQDNKARISSEDVEEVLEQGGVVASNNAEVVLDRMKKSMGF